MSTIVYNPFTDNLDYRGQPGGGGTVTSVTGTPDRITSTGGNTPQIDIAPTYVGQTSLTTLGTITTGTWNAINIGLNKGGTNASLTASNGGIFYSTATAGAILSGTATANLILLSGSSAAPSWSTATYPSAAGTSGNVLTSDGTNWVSSASPNTSQFVTVTGSLTNSQIKNLHATPIQVLPAPGAGKWYRMISANGKFIYGGSNVFTAGSGQTITWYYGTTLSTSVNLISNAVLVGSTTVYTPASTNPPGTYATTVENQPLNLYNSNVTEISGNAANDNTVTYSMTYQIISI